jgi:hypothetical protein
MEEYFREYIASDEPINTREKKFILELVAKRYRSCQWFYSGLRATFQQL